MTDEPLVLLTNDDGYGAAGIEAMAQALSEWARVVVVAPESEQSACGHRLTLHRALRVRRVTKDRFAIDGTPADCVYVALFSGTRFLPSKPQLVVSGINHGLNLGFDVYYSGTVAGAREAAMRGIPGLAVSADAAADLQEAALACDNLARALIACASQFEMPPIINANVPSGKGWKMTPTRIGRRLYQDRVEYRVDPRGREYLWLGGPFVSHDLEPGTDTHAFERGEIGVSNLPLVVASDQTSPAAEVVRVAARIDADRRK